jgi:hypothetical protein
MVVSVDLAWPQAVALEASNETMSPMWTAVRVEPGADPSPTDGRWHRSAARP